MARVNVKFGDLSMPQEIVQQVVVRINQVLLPEMEKVCEWYKEQVASFQYVYFDGYPLVQERMKKIILNASKENGNINIELQAIGNKIRFHIKVFDDSPGGYLDQATDTGRGAIGWWRYFEEGVPGQRNFGSSTFGFLVTGRRPDGRPKGMMVPAYSFAGGTKPKPHPGVFKVGVFEKTWVSLRSEFIERIRRAVQEAIKKL